ncbi:MAG: type II toxin-antitoxin system HicB family antitoxin [Clostridia bacterium]|nr:type II toxin-antitoxin system HicB family antitoxin [Clostridia bacterium]
MKTLDEYMSLPYKMELTPVPDEGGFVVSFPELPGCLTSGKTAEEALENARDAKESWISAALEDHIAIPEPDEDRVYSGQFKLRIPKSLHRSLAEHSRREGISLNQYCMFLLTKNDTSFR